MAKTEKENFKQLIYELVASIPRGKVATYGQLAFLAGYPGRSRQVGHLLAAAPAEPKLPCHRVVNHAGRTVPGWEEQRALLKSEGVPFKANEHADLDRCLWDAFDS